MSNVATGHLGRQISSLQFLFVLKLNGNMKYDIVWLIIYEHTKVKHDNGFKEKSIKIQSP